MAGIGGLEKRLQRALESQNYYDAEQAYQTIYHRLVAKGSSEGFFRLIQGSINLLLLGCLQEGTALAMLAVKHLATSPSSAAHKNSASKAKSSFIPYTEAKQALDGIFASLPSDDGLSVEDLNKKLRFAKAAVQWSSMRSEEPAKYGVEKWSAVVGKSLWKQAELKRQNAFMEISSSSSSDQSLSQNKGSTGDPRTLYKSLQNQSLQYFVRSDAPDCVASSILDSCVRSTNYTPTESAQLILHTVLLYLVTQNLADAILIFNSLSTDPSYEARIKGNADSRSYHNLMSLVIALVQKRPEQTAKDIFSQVVNRYKVLIDQDQTIKAMMDKIGLVYLKVNNNPDNGMAAFMNSLLRNIMVPPSQTS